MIKCVVNEKKETFNFCRTSVRMININVRWLNDINHTH